MVVSESPLEPSNSGRASTSTTASAATAAAATASAATAAAAAAEAAARSSSFFRSLHHDPLATNDPATNLALQMYRSKIDVGNENEDVDALFAANLAQETNRLAQDMNGMSAEEREEAYFDLHGIPSNSCSSTEMNSTSSSSSSPDTNGVTGSSSGTSASARCPQQVAAKWVEFQQEIEKLPDADRQGYELACELEAAKTLQPQHSPASSSSYSSSYQESYIHNEKLIRAFFQSSQWNCKAAAEQFVAFWAIKLQLFGKDLLLRDIKLSDLDAEEFASLETGFLQLLPRTDRAGRAVLFIYRRLMQPLEVEKQMRVFFYFLMTRVLQDLPDDTQRKGMVIVIYSINLETLYTTPEGPAKLPMLVSRLPLRVIATHSCTNHARQLHMFYLSSRFLGNFARVRSRVHFGSDTECHYALATFGMPTSLLTVTSRGDILVEDHLQWMYRQREREKKNSKGDSTITVTTTRTSATTALTTATTPPTHVVEDYPPAALVVRSPAISVVTAEEDDEDTHINRASQTRNDHGGCSPDRAAGGLVDDRDVLFGKGRGIQERPGNMRYRQLIESNMEVYNKSSKLKKRNVCEGIVQTILDSGGLFLKQEEPHEQKKAPGAEKKNSSKFTSVDSKIQWVIVDHEAALQKVFHGFRNKRSAMGQTISTVQATARANPKTGSSASSCASSDISDDFSSGSLTKRTHHLPQLASKPGNTVPTSNAKRARIGGLHNDHQRQQHSSNN